MGTPLALDRVTALPLESGATAVLAGLVHTSRDGATFDVPALFDLAAGGLRVVSVSGPRREVAVTPTGDPGPGCVAGGASTPCLVPRFAALAYERLSTQAELAATLSGGVELDAIVPPPPPPPSIALTVALWAVGVALASVALLAAVRAVARRLARTPLGRVRAAARAALRATRGDPTLERVRAELDAMCARARTLDAARRACRARLARIDVASLDARLRAAARSPSPEAAHALAWLTEEQAEAHRLDEDLASSVLGLERIESALRVVALRVREHRGTRARVEVCDPVDAAARELSLRDEALAEARALCPGAATPRPPVLVVRA